MRTARRGARRDKTGELRRAGRRLRSMPSLRHSGPARGGAWPQTQRPLWALRVPCFWCPNLLGAVMKPPRRALRAHGLVSRSLLLGLPVQRRPRPQDPRMGLRPTHGPSWTPGALQSTAWPRRHTTLRPRRAVFTSTSKGPPRPHPPCAPLCRRTASRCAVRRGSFTICPCRASRPSARTSTLLWCPWASCSGQASAAVFTLPAASSSPLRESSLTCSWTTVCGTCPSLTATLAPSAAPRPSRSRLSSLQAAAAHPGLRYPRRHRLVYPCRP